MNRNLYVKLGIIVAIAGISAWYLFPLEKKIRRGLDLQGGVHLVLEVEKPAQADQGLSDVTDRALKVVRNRIDALGITEPVIQKQGTNKIIVDIAGYKDPEKVMEVIGRTALLEFRLVSDDVDALKKALSGEVPEGYQLLYMKEKDERGILRDSVPLLVKSEPELTGAYLKDAYMGYSSGGFPDVNLEFNKEGAEMFSVVTGANINRRLAIILDGVVQSAPVIKERIPNGRAQITGQFSTEEAKELALVLRAGALPAKLEVVYKELVGPTLGKEYIRLGLRASLFGALIVILFMLFYYRAFGLLADVALGLNILVVLAILAGFKGVLTLPGIAGIALTVGMAVDANVLINERIREEQRAGKSPKTSVDNGYQRAWAAIIDSNITTLITGLVLFFMGEGPIKGFGLTLSIGIVANLFTAVFATKTIVDWFIVHRKVEKLWI
ncbi:MAG: protein translocase subunit SecD [Candidatus Omnitrophica bacterium]|nr:protein translocase subunit SecD [Candidatus Omnitrophota bacterium]MCM8768504.1 protein translocase subunit SecD [Candidatus Omnitrophota bacterium]